MRPGGLRPAMRIRTVPLSAMLGAHVARPAMALPLLPMPLPLPQPLLPCHFRLPPHLLLPICLYLLLYRLCGLCLLPRRICGLCLQLLLIGGLCIQALVLRSCFLLAHAL